MSIAFVLPQSKANAAMCVYVMQSRAQSGLILIYRSSDKIACKLMLRVENVIRGI